MDFEEGGVSVVFVCANVSFNLSGLIDAGRGGYCCCAFDTTVT